MRENSESSYPGIDVFRVVAAFLVVAIHTSPLLSFSETADFVLTRIIARTAVPFFFMTSGFFLITRYAENADRLRTFLKRTAIIYAAGILLYIPVNIYNGYFSAPDLLPKLIQDLIFDGTFYHLWYLPAAMLGAAVVWAAERSLGFRGAFILTGALYLIGIGGDSYYGFFAGNPFYEALFQIMEYTRNGLFFAPLFLVLGGYLAEKKPHSLWLNMIGLAASAAFLLAEGMLLRFWQVQRHDSMYLFLPVCMYFLFGVVCSFRGRRMARLRLVSLIVYIIHPLVIIAVRFAARLLHTEKLLIENSMVHFIAVCVGSGIIAVFAAAVYERLHKSPVIPDKTGRAWLEINSDNLRHNAAVLQSAMPPGCRLMAVVKAQAYGHGALQTAGILERVGVTAFAVATIDEGIALRKYGITGKILILGYTSPYRAKELKRWRLIQTIIDLNYAELLEAQNIKVSAHIKLDTGMHRLGIDAQNIQDIERVYSMKHLNVCGIFTHLCCCDSLKPEDVDFTRKQISRFYSALSILESDGINPGKVHVQSSYGMLNYPELKCDYVRAGIALYGVRSSLSSDEKHPLELRPVLSLKTRTALIRSIPSGETVGYGRQFTAQRDSIIAILPVGYADGVPRSLSCGNGKVEINGKTAPIIGLVCMDQLAVDITDIENVRVGDVAAIISAGGSSSVSAPEAAKASGTISNELLSRLGSRLEIV